MGRVTAGWRDGTWWVEPLPGGPDQPGCRNSRGCATCPHRRTPGRKGWLERGPGPDDRRGRDEFVPLPWEKALDLLAGELARVRDAHGPGAIFGGSYGWSSAGRFHHAQSQIHRFLNTALGGYVKSVNSYSAGASMVILQHFLGPMEAVAKRNVTWDQIAEHSEIVLAFGAWR